MNDNHVWFPSSFFYDIKKWHLVLSEIDLFLNEVIKNEFIHFHVSFNYVPIYNVQFAILCEREETMDKIGTKFYEYFTKFKEQYRPEKYSVEVKGIGMPYPFNTFQLGLYQILFNEKENSVYKAQQHFSKLIFSGLKTEAFTEEDTHTLAVYAVIILGKVMLSFNHLAGITFEKLQKEYFTLGFQIKEHFPEEFNEINNLSIQLLVINDIDNEEPWLADWFAFCKSDLEGNLENSTEPLQIESELRRWYIDKSNLITNQLGLPKETKDTLLSLINSSLITNT